MSLSYWGPHFPQPSGALSYWGGHFPEGDVDTGNPPTGAATFVLLLDAGVTVTYGWQTDVFKSYGGIERRAALLDDPLQTIRGTALLIGNAARGMRSTLARFAAIGRAFLLALPYEELTLVQDSSGTTVYPSSTTNCDWANQGQRVVIVASDNETFVEGVIQSKTSSTMVLDITPGAVGIAGGRIMPSLAVYFDPTQSFARYSPAEPVERWSIAAKLAVPGFASAAVAATLSLAPPLVVGGALDNVVLVARTPGEDGNNIVITQSADALTSGGELVEDVDAQTLTIKFLGDTTTVTEYVALLAGSELVGVSGTYAGDDSVNTSDEEFAATLMSGGVDLTQIDMGINASVTTFAGKPVYDRKLDNKETVGDSMNAMNEVLSLGAVPFSVGTAFYPDWGRQIDFDRIESTEWQWFKKFLGTVKGRAKSFWLPTWRIDMVYVSRVTVGGVSVVTVSGGDIAAWFPAQRSKLQIQQADGTIVYATIASIVTNADDSADLTLSVLLTSSAVTMMSWLDLCRLESDEVQVTFDSISYRATLQARAIQVTT